MQKQYFTSLQIISGEIIWNQTLLFSVNHVYTVRRRMGEIEFLEMGHTLHAMKQSEMINFDFLYMLDSLQEYKYELIVKGDLSSFLLKIGERS